ncbi:hypothetical protein JG687_00008754 [Phytophthora cactorum]|uniref:C2 domain-containing protein n=1 Tax=Phytophthora cactorum TaxID=29920 RepID=A0A8T1UDY9_9STRA|nr:hypothetical protein JG687_00008754 [Phytophthora cactorum]
MLQHAVALLLQRLLGKFVTFDSSMLKLSLWQGDLSFQDLQLRLSYGDGEIGHLSVKIPWRALWTQPVQIKAQGIRISLHQTPKPQHQAETTELESVDTSIDGSNGDDRTYLSRLVSHIIANVQIELSDVQVRYDCDPSSLAPQPGSGTLEIGHVSLINTNAEWELEFTPQSNSAMESKKLLKTEGVAAYIEYPDKQSTTGPEDELASPKMHRKYLFHEWRSTVKASLYYHSVNAAFPDVELDVDIGCDPGSMTEKCEICAAHDASGNERFVLQANQPRVHFGPEHIDVLYAILIEVKAPYDEYDRESVTTEEEIVRGTQWVWILGETVGVVKQSCVEDEIQLCVQSLRMYEVAERSESYSIIDHASPISENNGSAALVTPIVRISCVIPAYQSRLVGHQPALDVQLGSMMTFIKDETLVMWMTLFAPVYLWWNQWNLSHPSKLVTYNDAQIAPIAHLGIKMEKICFPESLSEAALSSYFGISLSMNELSIGTGPEQYTTLLGMIYENFREVSRVVTEDTYPLCATCGGLHHDSEYCSAIWMRIPVKIADAALRISNKDHPVADLFWEQLELVFTLRTDDSVEFNGSALSFTTADIRPSRCQTASEIVRPLPGDGLQIEYNQKMNWTDAVYDLKVRNTNFLGVYPAFHDIIAFFAEPVFTEGEFLDFGVGYMSPPPPDWQKIDFFLTTSGCLFSLLEDFETTDARALVMLTDVVTAYSTHQKCKGATDMTKCHLEFDQHGVYFSQLPDLQIDASFPLSNSFLLVFDHFVEGSISLSRRNSFVLAPVETRFSVQDANLFINIANNYLRWIPSPSRSNSAKVSPCELLGDVGELRLVLVNNSLGIPIADFHMREIVCEYIQDEDYSTTMGATLLFNYFNNSIYRWEPLVEPFVVQMRIHRALEENSLVEVFANLPNTVNFNMTPAMAPLLSSEALRQADFVTSGSKSTAPFWVENKTGLELKFSFRRGTGTVIQQIVPDNGKVSVDCREQGDMLTFDSASADRFLRETDRQALTVNHTLSVWLNGNKWVSTNPVVVDMVGHVAVPLRESLAPVVDADAIDFENGGEEDISPPTLVAEISIQADGSKLISLHSQVVLQNRTSVPLMVWAFSPREGGCIQEWIIDREQICHIPLQLVHPQSKISIRPSPYVQYAPLTTSLEELGDEVRAAKSVNTKRFVRAGNCVCNFETFATMEELQSAAKSLEMVSSSSMSSAIPLSGYVVRDLPTWKCTYEVEAYYLMRATFSKTEEPPPVEQSAVDLERVEEEEGEKVEDDFLHVFGEPAQRQRMNPLRDVNYELDEARAAGQRRGLYEATNSSLYYLSVSPFLTLHNRLATAMAYRLLNGSLQLIAEGILAVGNVLPLFQVDASELLYVSFRLENYSWSAPKLIINPKMSVYSVPYKETIEPVQLLGRAFDRDITGEQGSVPNLQLQVKLSGRDVIVFCSIWIVNHTDLDLEYCNSTSSSSKRLETVLKYVHRRAGSSEEYSEDFSARSMSFHGEGGRETQLTRLHKVKPSTNPVAVIVVIREARDLYNAQFFGAQSPYVRASLYVLKNPKDRYLEKPEMVAICSTTTKPSPSGGLAPQWDARLQNTLLLRFPPEVRTLELARIIIEVRNVRYGLDTCLGVTAVKVDSILKDRKRAAAFNWYKLLKRKSSRERKASKNNLASIHRGDISISFSVGTSQELPSDMDAEDTVEEAAEEHSSIHDEEMTVSYLERQESEDFELDDMEHSLAMDGQQTPGPLPSTSAARSLQRLQTPSSHDMGLIGAPTTMRARQAYTFSGEIESSHSQELLSYDPTSTRAMGALITNGSPTKPAHTGRPHGIQVYLPHNRFACVVVEVYSSSLMSEVFDLVCMKCGFVGVLDIEDFDFYELALPRFVSLRSAGRPEGERWYGQPIPMTSKIESKGRRHGLHLCHRITMTTIRLYDEASTASSHHVTPRSLVTSSKRSNPAQIRPMPWGDVLPYSSGGKHWDVLRIKSRSSPWSDVIRLNRNAMGNSGVAQVISLTNEVYDQDQESELRKGTQEVALWSCYGSGRFSETIMATVVPRYILINKTEETIKFRQFDAPQTFRLAANELVPFHWPSASREKLLEVSLLHKYSWSGSFRINSLGTTYLKLRDRNDLSRIYILQCQIELVGGSVALIFREESKRFPPYRIDNMTSFRIRYKQTNWGEDKDFDQLLPRSSCAYSWDYLNGSDGKSSSSSNQDPAFPGSSSSSSRSLQVRFMRVTSSTSKTGGDSDKDAVEIREYNLDEMATHKRIQLHRSLPSELFLKPEQKGYLLKKDSMLKWNRKYFRLYEHMLYYFANETDQELLGVVDLRTGSDVPGVGGVAIFEKAAEAPSKSGFISLNGLVSSISGSLFGGGSRQKNGGEDDDDDDGDDRSRELVRFAVSLTTSSVLCEESEKFVNAHIESGTFARSGVTRKGFYVNGQDLVDFLVTEMSTQTKAQAFTTAQEMMELGVLKPIQISSDVGAHKQAPLRSFQCSKVVWYSVDSINLSDDSDLDSEDSSSITTPRDSDLSTASSKAIAKPPVVGSNQFSIITPTKCYDLKAKNPKIAKIWVRRLRLATQGGQVDDIEEMPEETPMAGAPRTMRSQRDLVPQVQNAKTYVHVRIRADGPTKVLELFEGGEEDFDERENKYELSSTASASSDSPTASETSATAFESLTSGMALHLRVDGVGISCVNELPMELVYIYLGGISLHYSRVNSNMRMNVTLDDVQIDNQSEEATFTKLLCPRMENGAAAAVNPTRKRTIGDIDEDLAEMVSQGRGAGGGNGDDDSPENTGLISNQNIFSCADCKYRQANVAAMHFCCTWSNEQGNTDYFKHCSFWLYPVTTQLDEELLVSARAFMAAMTQSWGQNRSQNRGGEIRMKSIPIEMMMESLAEYRENTYSDELNPLTNEMKRSSSAPSSFGDSNGDDSSSMTWAIPSLTMHVPDLDNAPVRLNALMIEHAFGTSGDLTRRVSKYYTRQLWKQLHKILGSFDFLGNPVGFLDHIGTGVRDFVYEPLEGLKIGGKGFSKGLAKGTASLMSNTVDGTFDAASKISGTFGQGFANLSLDDHYQQNRARARRRHVRGLREGLVQGSRELSLGVYEGVAGLVLNPMRGAQESGAVGFVKGTITGIIGLPVKPVAGIFDFASRATQGVRNRSLQNGQNMRRVRRPRVFGRYNELKCYKEADTIAYELLKRVGGERLSGEKIIFYNEIMQSVSAADLTREARDRRRSGSNGSSKLKSNDSTRERTNSLRRALQEDDERRRAAGELPNAGTGETSGRKLRYEVVFYHKKMGMDLETDFYCENVTIKAMDETSRSKVKVRGHIASGQQVLQEGDCLLGVGGVDVRGIGFHETLALLRGTARPITVQFESAEELMQEAPTPKPDSSDGGEVEFGATSRARLRRLSLAGPGAGNDAVDESIKKLKVQLSHWLIVTEQRVLYINVGSYTKPVVEWMTPLRYIYRVEWQKNAARICLHLSVGVDSLPMGPRLRPSLKAIDGHERDMNVFLDVMWHSFGSATAEEQELWPSDTIVERVQSEVVLVAASTQELEMWQSSLAHAAGKGMRHSRGTRFFVPTAASRLEIGTQETPDFVVKPLAEALKKTELPTTRVFWVGVAAFRLWNALFVRTSFNPDEYWQSTEVAHRLVFGYGYLTWEWQDDAQLRGFAHPALFAGLYKLLELLNLDSRWAVAYGPRLMQGLISAANDFFLYKLARNYVDAKAAKWALLCQFFSWFTFYVMVRPFSNCVETLCTTAALAYWPWKFLEDGADKKNDDAAPVKRRNRALALVLAALGVLFRPTNAIIWLYPGIVHFLQTRDHAYLMFGLVMPIAIVTTLTMLCIDRLGYGEWTFVPFNFFKFNVLEGKDKLYGEHPWSWYFSQGYPAIVGTTLPIVIAGYLTVPSSKKDLGRVIMWALFVYSNATHKEFRFVLPLLPPAFVYAGYCLRNLERKLYVQFRERTQWNLLRLAVFSVIVPNVLSAYYLSRSHQRAPVEVMDYLADRIQENPEASIHFWTPCHATPYYSYLHQNVSMWFPDCSPANRERTEGCESHQLERDPRHFLTKLYHLDDVASDSLSLGPPTYVVTYSTIAARIRPLLVNTNFVEAASFLHSDVSGDADSSEVVSKMLVYKRE